MAGDLSFLIDIVASFAESQKNLNSFAAKMDRTVSDIKDNFGSAGASLKTVFAGAIGAAAAFGAAFSLKKVIDEAAQFEEDVNRLRIALDATGQATNRTIDGFIEYAAQLQATTKYSDGTVLSTSALLQSLAQLSGTALKDATKASLDLATALVIDVNTAATMVGKAASGNIATFQRYGIEIRKGTTDSETFANTLRVIGERYGGASEKSLNTFSGAIKNLTNNFADSVKELGLAIIKNTDFVNLIKTLSNGFVSLAKYIQENNGAISRFITSGINAATTAIKILIPVIVGATTALVAYKIATLAAAASSMAFVPALAAIGVALKGMAVAAWTAIAPLAPFIAIGVAAAGLAAFAIRVYKIRDSFASLADAIYGAALEIGSIVAKFFGLNSVAEKFDGIINRLKGKKIELDASEAQQSIDDLRKESALMRQSIEDDLKAKEIETKKKQAELEELTTANVKKILETYKNGGLSEREIIEKNRKESLKIVSDSEKLHIEITGGAAALRNKINQEANKKLAELDKKAKDEELKRYQDLRAAMDAASASIPDFVRNLEKMNKLGASPLEKLSVGLQAAGNSIKEGAEGARKAVVGALTFAASQAFGPIGESLGPFLDAFSQGPEAVRKMVNDFFNAIPVIVQNIILSIPVFIQAIIDNLGPLIQALVDSMPTVIQGLINSIGPLIQSLANAMPSVALNFASQMPFVATQLAFNLIAKTPEMVKAFIDGLIAGAGQFIQAIVDGVKNALGNIGGLAGGGGGGILGGVTGGVKKIGKVFGLAEGGVVPSGYPGDTYPAALSSGEGIVPSDTMRKLDQFISGGSGSSGGTTTIINKIYIGEQELAQSILNLNRQGFRMST